MHARVRLLRTIFNAFMIGVFAAITVTLFRLGISNMAKIVRLPLILAEKTRSATSMPGLFWFLIMATFGIIAAWFSVHEPLISGGGIPQVAAQMSGRLKHVNPLSVLACKFFGCIITLGTGLSLGRGGPSVQIGAMVGSLWGKILGIVKCNSEITPDLCRQHNLLLSSGAAAGLAATFNSPITGIVFAIEELHKSVSPDVLISIAVASLTAAFTADITMGTAPTLNIPAVLAISHKTIPNFTAFHYVFVILIGLASGLGGVVFNYVFLFFKNIYLKIYAFIGADSLSQHTHFGTWVMKGLIPFLITATAIWFIPELFASGEPFIFLPATAENPEIANLAVFYVAKLLLLVLASASGLPGGIFFPTLVLGSLIGNICAQAFTHTGLLSPKFVLVLSLLAMAGHFAAILRLPLTGILLLTELTDSFEFLLPIGVTAFTAYIVAEAFRPDPNYQKPPLINDCTSKGTGIL